MGSSMRNAGGARVSSWMARLSRPRRCPKSVTVGAWSAMRALLPLCRPSSAPILSPTTEPPVLPCLVRRPKRARRPPYRPPPRRLGPFPIPGLGRRERTPAATARPIPGLRRRGRPPRRITPALAPVAWTRSAIRSKSDTGRSRARARRRPRPAAPEQHVDARTSQEPGAPRPLPFLQLAAERLRPSRDVERRPWPPDARAPPAKDPPASRPPPRHPHLAGDLHQVPSSARATLRPQPRSSAARALQPPRARSRGEELPPTSLSSAGKPAGRPRLLLASLLLPFFSAVTHHPFLGSCGVDAGGKRRPQMDKRWCCPVVKQFN